MAEKVLLSPSQGPAQDPAQGCLSTPSPPLSPPWDHFCCRDAGDTSGFSFPALVIEAVVQTSPRKPWGLRESRQGLEETRRQARPVPTGSLCPGSRSHLSSACADLSCSAEACVVCASRPRSSLRTVGLWCPAWKSPRTVAAGLGYLTNGIRFAIWRAPSSILSLAIYELGNHFQVIYLPGPLFLYV